MIYKGHGPGNYEDGNILVFSPEFSSSFVVFVRFAVLYVSLLDVKCEVNPCLEHRSALYCYSSCC